VPKQLLGAHRAASFRFWATIWMGVGIPALSVGLSYEGGEKLKLACKAGCLLSADAGLAALAFTLMACVLAVSLSHLSWGIRDITRSPEWASWLLAVALDMTLVLGELIHVHADSRELMATALMVGVIATSMYLNCWAFLFHHRAADARKNSGEQLTK
jgi:hypothetical protein